MTLLLVEDDLQLNNIITRYFTLKNDIVVSIYDGEEAIEIIDNNNFDFYIIDINLPNINGLEIVKYVRQKDHHTPIVMITASLELENFKTAYLNGCNEYIKKPFFLEELKIRMDKLLTKKEEITKIIIISPSVSYDLELEELKVDGEIKKLRKKQKRLLTLLLNNMNKTVSIPIIENYVWENEIKERYPLRQLVNDLRREFNEKFIYTDVGIGYKFKIKKG